MSRLSYDLHTVESLGAHEHERMFALFAASYESISRQQFEEDLSWKQYAGILRDEHGTIQGFSTLALNPRGYLADYDILFSGDTIISPEYWGTQELVRGFCKAAGTLASRGRKLYWYLISKGHRTYLYLPLFCRRFFPDRRGTCEDLRQIADDCSRYLYGAAWRPEAGILQFKESHGELTRALAHATHLKAAHKDVAFFLERNPGFERGDELVCVTELCPENLRGLAARYLLEGIRSGSAV